MTCPISPRRLGWSCATNISLDTNQVTPAITAPGEKSRSSWLRPRACRPSMFTPRRDTTPPTSRFSRLGSFVTVLLLAAAAVSVGHAQQPSQPAPPPAPGTQQQNQPPAQGQQGGNYSIQRDVNLVVLHASVVNERGQFVPGLKEDAFRILEDKAE